MAGSKSDYLEDKVLRHFLKGATYAQPTHIYMALFTVAPTDAGGGTEVPDTNGYARQIVDAWTFSGTSPTQAVNTGAITFPAATPAGWGTIVAWALFDSLASGSGNMIYWGNGLSKAIGIGDVAEFAAGACVITED